MTRASPISLQSPGSLGLNTEDQDDVLDHRYATTAYNCVLSRNGRIESREGWVALNSASLPGNPTIDVVHSYVSDSGTEVLVSAGGNKVFTGDTVLTDSTGSLAVTEDNWQFQNAQGNCYGVQSLHEPIFWNGSGDFEYLVDQNTAWAASTVKAAGDLVIPTTRNGYYYECTTANTTNDTEGEPAWSTTLGGTTTETDGVVWTTRQIPQSNVALTAYGRLWLSDDTTIYYSDLLIPSSFDTGGTTDVGSAGKIDLNTVWVTSNDSIVALSVHNNFLIILCKKSVIVYSGIDNITNLALSEVIENIGCMARDTVQSIGQDLLWLSEEGVRSLGRTILQNNMPLSTISEKVRSSIVSDSSSYDDLSDVRSAYNERKGMYIITMPKNGLVYVFDVRLISKQVIRPFIWNSINPYGAVTRRNGDLIFGMKSGKLGRYSGYLDNGLTYLMDYKSGWIDPGSNGMELIWKNMRFYIYSSYSLNVAGTWDYDFQTTESSQAKSLVPLAGSVSEYNIAEYGVDEYGYGESTVEVNFNLTGTGELIKIGFEAKINNGKVGVNKVTLKAKRGRIN